MKCIFLTAFILVSTMSPGCRLHPYARADGTVKATMGTDRDKDLPLNDVKETGLNVEFGIKITHARFEGSLNEEGTELVGKLIHGHGDHEDASSLTLRKEDS
jgi:hypothetical protein